MSNENTILVVKIATGKHMIAQRLGNFPLNIGYNVATKISNTNGTNKRDAMTVATRIPNVH